MSALGLHGPDDPPRVQPIGHHTLATAISAESGRSRRSRSLCKAKPGPTDPPANAVSRFRFRLVGLQAYSRWFSVDAADLNTAYSNIIYYNIYLQLIYSNIVY